jgi:hypothetical protein
MFALPQVATEPAILQDDEHQQYDFDTSANYISRVFLTTHATMMTLA